MDRGTIKTEILVRSGKDTTSAWISEAFLNDWINQSHRWAAGYKKWPFTEGRVSTTYTSVEEWNFEGYKSDSFRLLQIGGQRFQKLNFEDYQIYKEKNPNGTDKIYSDFGKTLFINTASGASGTMTAYGQYMPANIPDGDENDNLETVFSDGNDEGNEAIVEKGLEYIAKRERKDSEAMMHAQNAKQVLDDLWTKIEAEQHMYHTKDRGIFPRFDVITGRNIISESENQF
jgi:hypothetical protein